MSTNETLGLLIVLAVAAAFFGILYFACTQIIGEFESRLGRSLEFWEILLLGLTFPYSLLLLIVLRNGRAK